MKSPILYPRDNTEDGPTFEDVSGKFKLCLSGLIEICADSIRSEVILDRILADAVAIQLTAIPHPLGRYRVSFDREEVQLFGQDNRICEMQELCSNTITYLKELGLEHCKRFDLELEVW